MSMCTEHTCRVRRGRIAGYTVAEVVIAAGIGAIVAGVVLTTGVSLFREFTAESAYREVHQNARHAMAYLTRDLRAGAEMVGYTPTDITLRFINMYGHTNTVRYYLQNDRFMRREMGVGSTNELELTDNVTSVQFKRFTNPGAEATTLADTYELRAFLTITNRGSRRIVSDLLQTRVLFRNKNLL